MKLHITHMLKLKFWWEKTPRTYAITLWELKKLFKRACALNLLQLLTSSVIKYPLEDYQKRLQDIAYKRQAKQTSHNKEYFIFYHTLAQYLAAEDKNNEEIRTFDLPL